MNNEEFLHLQEITEAEFCEHIEDDDFFLVYGNPVVIHCNEGFKIIAIAWPLAERLMRLAGRGEEVDEINRLSAEKNDEDPVYENEDPIKYWIYEFEMPDEVRQEIEAICRRYELTHDEFFEAAMENAIHMAKTDPEGFKQSCLEAQQVDSQIRLAKHLQSQQHESDPEGVVPQPA